MKWVFFPTILVSSFLSFMNVNAVSIECQEDSNTATCNSPDGFLCCVNTCLDKHFVCQSHLCDRNFTVD